MKKTKVIIFDFDGTLVDTKIDIARSVNFLLKEENLPPIPEEKIYEFIGKGTDILLEKSFSYVNGKIKDGVTDRYFEIYEEHMLDNTRPFPKVLDMLESIKDRLSLYILTNKHERFAVKILKHFGILNYFKEVVGADTFGVKKPNPFGIVRIINKEKVDREKILMVGDSAIDIKTGKNAKVLTCGVLWGLGKIDELMRENPDFLIAKPYEILDIVN